MADRSPWSLVEIGRAVKRDAASVAPCSPGRVESPFYGQTAVPVAKMPQPQASGDSSPPKELGELHAAGLLGRRISCLSEVLAFGLRILRLRFRRYVIERGGAQNAICVTGHG